MPTLGQLARRPVRIPPWLPSWRVLREVGAHGEGASAQAGRGAAPAPGPSFWLDSAASPAGLGGWSFAGDAPLERILLHTEEPGTGFDRVRAALERLRGRSAPAAWRAARERLGVPFAGGAVGALSYDLGPRLERVRPPAAGEVAARADTRFPLLEMGLYAHVVALEHASGELAVVGLADGIDGAVERVEQAVEAARRRLAEAPDGDAGGARPEAALAPARSSLSDAAFEDAVRQAQALIRAGDIFEVNLTRRCEGRVTPPDDALTVYDRLRAGCPAPFAARLCWPGGEAPRALCSASPERFLRVVGDRVEARPIKGTRPRGATGEDDRRLADELLASAKDRAELAMIVDLLRNDLGRVAAPGTVRVVDPAERIAFPQVHHLVGHVTCRLAAARDGLDALAAAFPCGSITGAPKPRAMEVIDRLEPVQRGAYTGAIGWVGADLDLDLAVTIRTIALEGERAWFGIGGAITIDSEPASELEETRVKGRALARVLGLTL